MTVCAPYIRNEFNSLTPRSKIKKRQPSQRQVCLLPWRSNLSNGGAWRCNFFRFFSQKKALQVQRSDINCKQKNSQLKLALNRDPDTRAVRVLFKFKAKSVRC